MAKASNDSVGAKVLNTQRLKCAVYSIAKLLGLFAYARKATSKGLRILCYHGVSTTETHRWRPMLFMRPCTFDRRMQLLASLNYPVLSLDDAARRLREGSLPANATVITIDDGFRNTHDFMLPTLEKLQLSATIYVTSYYALAEEPIFELVVQFLIWKAGDDDSTINDTLCEMLGVPQTDSHQKQLLDEFGKAEVAQKRIICEKLAELQGLELSEVLASGDFSLMDANRIRSSSQSSLISVQLHTRRHRFPQTRDQAAAEIEENRADLGPLVNEPLVHFCYPSGKYASCHFEWLEELGVKTATVTDNGLNFPGSNPFRLTRYLDSDQLSDIEFEAELSGFAHMLRSLIGR